MGRVSVSLVRCLHILEYPIISKANKGLEDNPFSFGSAVFDLFRVDSRQYDSGCVAYVYPAYSDRNRLRRAMSAAAFYFTEKSRVYPGEVVNPSFTPGLVLESSGSVAYSLRYGEKEEPKPRMTDGHG
ncbi:MAG: hypothetical protein AAGJ81_08175 [Verrucomicrobiota bacterium]